MPTSYVSEKTYIGFIYGDVSDESEFLRSFRAVWQEIKSGQCLRLVGIEEDLSCNEGAGERPNVANVKDALKKK
jgi:hypothetical protein